MEVHKALGAGFLEAVYQEALSMELAGAGIPFVKEKILEITYKGTILEKKYVADFVCFDEVIVELKAVDALSPDHIAQVLNYLKATGKKIGLLINFGSRSLQYKRVIL
jgi:GxxExxY protein